IRGTPLSGRISAQKIVFQTEDLWASAVAHTYDGWMSAVPTPASEVGDGCAAIEADLGWALGVVFRTYLKVATVAMAEVPGGPRGYQVLAAAERGSRNTQLVLAQQLGIDRTVMTYLLDDLEGAGLIQRQPDPADRRA